MFFKNYQFLHHHIHHFHGSDILGSLANIVTILGIFGLVFAYLEYKNKVKEEKRLKIKETLRVITSIKYQLKVIKSWASYDKGGYKEEDVKKWLQENYLERIRPFHKVFKLDYSYLKNVTVLPGIELFDDQTNEAAAQLIQSCCSFNDYLDEIKSFKYSRPAEKNMLLNQKFDFIKNYTDFFESLNDEDKLFTDTLLNMYTALHFKIIGDENKKSLHFWHKKLIDLLDNLETEKKRELEEIK